MRSLLSPHSAQHQNMVTPPLAVLAQLLLSLPPAVLFDRERREKEAHIGARRLPRNTTRRGPGAGRLVPMQPSQGQSLALRCFRCRPGPFGSTDSSASSNHPQIATGAATKCDQPPVKRSRLLSKYTTPQHGRAPSRAWTGSSMFRYILRPTLPPLLRLRRISDSSFVFDVEVSDQTQPFSFTDLWACSNGRYAL